MVDVGREGCLMMGAIATASIPPLPRVLRAAASHTRSLPSWSVHFDELEKSPGGCPSSSYLNLAKLSPFGFRLGQRTDAADLWGLTCRRHGEVAQCLVNVSESGYRSHLRLEL